MVCPTIDDGFFAYHADLYPENIFVKLENGKPEVTAIIDWEFFAYWPRFWIATCPCQARFDRWGTLLKDKLVGLGFNDLKDWHREFEFRQDELRDERGGEPLQSFRRSLQAS